MITTIQVDTKIKLELDKLKVHHRETYNELISRLIQGSSPKNADRESLLATIEILSNPTTMKNISEALQQKEGTPLKDVKKEFGL